MVFISSKELFPIIIEEHRCKGDMCPSAGTLGRGLCYAHGILELGTALLLGGKVGSGIFHSREGPATGTHGLTLGLGRERIVW